MLARANSVTSKCVRPVFVNGDDVVIRWIFRFDWLDGTITQMEELACQPWSASASGRRRSSTIPRNSAKRGPVVKRPMKVLTEKERMLAGEPYNPADATLPPNVRMRDRCVTGSILSIPLTTARCAELLGALLGVRTDTTINPPFHCDYGYNIALGPNAYFNVSCVVLDVVPVTIGRNALFGPAVQIYTAMHPLSAEERRSGLEYGKPVDIGDDVWVGGGAVICPGVSVGSGSVVGAGSVVTRDLPAGVFAAGNPCRVIRKLNL